MTAFFDYDMTVDGNGQERYVLCRNCTPMVGRCTITPHPTVPGAWLRKIMWRSKHATRYILHRDLDDALTSGIKWARRRTAEDRRELTAS
jgi:hypothetical protein